MSLAAEARPEKEPKNVLWICTFTKFISLKAVIAAVGEIFQSPPSEISPCRGLFTIQVTKVDEEKLMISLLQVTGTEFPDPGCMIRVGFTVHGIDEQTKTVDWRFGDEGASVFYKWQSFISTCDLSKPETCLWNLKVVVKMHEYENLDNDMRKLLESTLNSDRPKYVKNSRQLKDLAYIVKRPGLTDVFTGREVLIKGFMKLSVIMRTAAYSREVVAFLKAKERADSKLPKFNYEEIFFYLAAGAKNAEMVVDVTGNATYLYRMAHEYGLDYLQAITREYLLNNLNDYNVLVDAFRFSAFVDDEELFNQAADLFAAKLKEVMKCQKWVKLTEDYPMEASWLIYHMRMRLTSLDLLQFLSIFQPDMTG